RREQAVEDADAVADLLPGHVVLVDVEALPHGVVGEDGLHEGLVGREEDDEDRQGRQPVAALQQQRRGRAPRGRRPAPRGGRGGGGSWLGARAGLAVGVLRPVVTRLEVAHPNPKTKTKTKTKTRPVVTRLEVAHLPGGTFGPLRVARAVGDTRPDRQPGAQL